MKKTNWLEKNELVYKHFQPTAKLNHNKTTSLRFENGREQTENVKNDGKNWSRGPPNLVPRSHSVTENVRSGKLRFRACSVPARPEIRAFLSLRMFVLSVVILGDFVE